MEDAFLSGLVLIDKPSGWTSHDVVNRLRKIAGIKRAGHLGTLDPMATGLLGVLTGTATRLAPWLGSDDKTYVAEIGLGVVSNTYDADGEVRQTGIALPSDRAHVESALDEFRGRVVQIPPAFSAKKISGVPAYKLARKQLEVALPPIEVEIKELELTSWSSNRIQLLVTSSAGTYIRSLAHDLGQRLGCGAVLTGLRRTRTGDFLIEQAHTLEELSGLAAAGNLKDALTPAARLLPHIPAEFFDVQTVAHIRQGRKFRTSPFVVPPASPIVKALSHSGELVAIGELIFPNFYHPKAVF